MKQTTAIEFNDLPKPIRSWLASTRNTDFLIEFNRKLGIDGAQRIILPELVYRIATLNLEPRDLVSEIALQLNLSDSSAKIIAQELEKNVFHEVEDVLREELGLDISQLHFGRDLGPLPQVVQAPRIIPVQVLPPKLVPLQTERYIGASQAAKASEGTKALEAQEAYEAPIAPLTGPFILHAEKEEIKPQVSTQPSRPTFSIKIPITQKKYYSTPAPVVARIETPTLGASQATGVVEASPASKAAKAYEAKEAPQTPHGPLPMKPLSEIVGGVEVSQAAKASSEGTKALEAKEAYEAPAAPQAGRKIVHYSSFYTKL